jgi:sarcosine oxidase, subunit beta
VAVLERGWLGGGNVARNTVTIRSNYMRDESIPFYVRSVAMYDALTREVNFNTMPSKRGMVDVLQTWGMVRDRRRRRLTMDLHGSTYRPMTCRTARHGARADRRGRRVAPADPGGGIPHRCLGQPP